MLFIHENFRKREKSRSKGLFHSGLNLIFLYWLVFFCTLS